MTIRTLSHSRAFLSAIPKDEGNSLSLHGFKMICHEQDKTKGMSER